MNTDNNIIISLCIDIPNLNNNENIIITIPSSNKSIEKTIPIREAIEEEPPIKKTKIDNNFFNELFDKTTSTDNPEINKPVKNNSHIVIDFKYKTTN